MHSHLALKYEGIVDINIFAKRLVEIGILKILIPLKLKDTYGLFLMKE
jgi:hypothetical protein